MSRELKDAMKVRFPVWSAVLAGMASPASLYAEEQDYYAYARPREIGQAFQETGAFISNALAKIDNVGKQARPAETGRSLRNAS